MADDAMPWFLVGFFAGSVMGALIGALAVFVFMSQGGTVALAAPQMSVQRDEVGRIVAMRQG